MTEITVEVVVDKNVKDVWKCWTDPACIMQWNQASEDWYCPKATNDLRDGGHFSSIMAARDKSTSFDFNGTYLAIIPYKKISYVIEGGRKVNVVFESIGDNSTRVIETFEAVTIHSLKRQRNGWRAILKSFKQFCEMDQ